MARNDPYRNFRFRLEIQGIQQAGFQELAMAENTADVIDYREGNEPTRVRKLPGLTKYGNITLKHGMTASSMELYNWYKSIVDGQIGANRKTVTIVVVDEAGADKGRFLVTEAWPMKYDVSDFNAKGNEVLVESLELANEGVERTA
jgi:phage tail-like protein